MITKEQVNSMFTPRAPVPSSAGLLFGLRVMALRRESLKGKRVPRKVKP